MVALGHEAGLASSWAREGEGKASLWGHCKPRPSGSSEGPCGKWGPQAPATPHQPL